MLAFAMSLACSAALPAAPAPQGSLTLVTDPAGAASVSDCSADGSVLCGVTATGPGLGIAWTWTAAAGFTQLPASPLSGFPLAPRAISGDGQAVVGWVDSPMNVVEAFRWTATSGLTLLPAVSNQAGIALSSAEACNADGTLVGGYAYHTDLDQPTVWDAGGTPTILPFVQGAAYGVINDITGGDVVVGGQWSAAVEVGFRWTAAAGVTALPGLPGALRTGALASSGDCSVTFGYVGDAPFRPTRAVRWNPAGTVEVLFDLPPGTRWINELQSDAAGRSIVGTYRDDQSEFGFHWSEAEGLRTMSELFADVGISVPGDAFLPRAISDDGNVIVGTRRGSSSSGSLSAGFVLRLRPAGPVPIGTEFCAPAVPNSTGASPSLGASGSDEAAASDVALWVTDLPARSFGIFLASQTAGAVPAFGGGAGTLCLGSPFGRFAASAQVRSSGSLGRVSLRIDPGAIPGGTGTIAAQPGASWAFQYWYRDVVGGGSTSNLSSARTIQFR